MNADSIVELLRERGKLPVREIAAELETAPREVHDRLGRLCEAGQVVQVSQGIYRAASNSVGRHNVLLVGGEETLCRQNITPRLESVGLHVEWYWPYKSAKDSGKPIPAACEAVIILTDLISHAQCNTAVLLAKQRSLPFVRGTHKWSYLLRQLIDQHIITVADATRAVRALEPTPILRAAPSVPEPMPVPEPARPEPRPEPAPPAPVEWSASSKSLQELLRVFKLCVAELITGHGVVPTSIRVDENGKIKMEKEKKK